MTFPSWRTVAAVTVAVVVADYAGNYIVNKYVTSPELNQSDKYINDAKTAAVKGLVGTLGFVLFNTAFGGGK